MPESETYGDSDDDALLLVATQHEQTQGADEFEASPRPAKRARIEGPHDQTASDLGISEEDLLGDDTLLELGDVQEEQSPNKRQRLFHAPRVQANLERVILTQTQVVPASQPWEIRGPVWKRPKPKTPEKRNGIASYFSGQQKEVNLPAIPQTKTLAQIIEISNKEASKTE
jgi:hypothetical protein